MQGRATPFDGDLDDYARWFMTSAATTQADDAAAKSGRRSSEEQKKQRKREEAERRNRLSPLRAKSHAARRASRSWNDERAEIEAALATPDIYGEQAKQRLQELLQAQTQLQRDLRRAKRPGSQRASVSTPSSAQ